MIFLTVGTQLPFDRLVQWVDNYAFQNPSVKIYGQIGVGEYQPKYFDYTDFLSHSESESLFEKSNVIISHAGMGSILTALTYGKSILIIPRLADKNEHRNDHQVATSKRFSGFDGVFSAYSIEDMTTHLSYLNSVESREPVASKANPEMTAILSNLIRS